MILTSAVAFGLLAAEDPARAAERHRIAVIDKLKPAVVAVFANGGQGGGSGVVIDPDGYALTNFHVVQGVGPTMKCGLPDGILYDAVLVGLDRVGDVALIKLLPKEKGKPFPFVPPGDSDPVRPGDWSIAAGNPFLLATDFTPTVTYGLVSGTHRYQYPAGTLLEYTDCIQVDTSINPGNSGGPLFNASGELIGINGRISLEKRGRINSGVGYAISINQIKNFLGHLRAGIDTDHATLGATVRTVEDEDLDIQQVLVQAVLDESDAGRRGLQPGDELVEFAGRPVTNTNQYKNVLGIYPKGWRLPIVYRRDNTKREALVRLMGVLPKEEHSERPRPGRPGQPLPKQKPGPKPNAEAMKLVKEKPGYANYFFNEQARERVWKQFQSHGNFTELAGRWTLRGELQRGGRATPLTVDIVETPAADGIPAATVVKADIAGVEIVVDPFQADADPRVLRSPPGSNGLFIALYQYRRLLTRGPSGFEGGFVHAGNAPLYPPSADGQPKPWTELRADGEVLRSEHAAVRGEWWFRPGTSELIGAEVWLSPDEDPCELYFDDYRDVNGRRLPFRINVRAGDDPFGAFVVKDFSLAKAE